MLSKSKVETSDCFYQYSHYCLESLRVSALSSQVGLSPTKSAKVQSQVGKLSSPLSSTFHSSSFHSHWGNKDFKKSKIRWEVIYTFYTFMLHQFVTYRDKVNALFLDFLMQLEISWKCYPPKQSTQNRKVSVQFWDGKFLMHTKWNASLLFLVPKITTTKNG